MTSTACHTPPSTGAAASRACPGCGASLDHRDPQVLTCGARCRQRVHRAGRPADYDAEADYQARAATWDPDAALARVQALDLQPAAAVPLVDPAEHLRRRRWLPLVDPTDPRRRRERSDL